jgi:hypothetical protein
MATSPIATHAHKATHLVNEDAFDRVPGFMA